MSMPTPMATILRSDFLFKWVTSHIKYLGIFLPSEIEDIFSLNFPLLLSAFKRDLQSWQHGLFSWFRCGIVKMNIMPQILYHLQALPIRIPRSFLRAVNRTITILSITNRTIIILPMGPESPEIGPVYFATAKSDGWHGSTGRQHLS